MAGRSSKVSCCHDPQPYPLFICYQARMSQQTLHPFVHSLGHIPLSISDHSSSHVLKLTCDLMRRWLQFTSIHSQKLTSGLPHALLALVKVPPFNISHLPGSDSRALSARKPRSQVTISGVRTDFAKTCNKKRTLLQDHLIRLRT